VNTDNAGSQNSNFEFGGVISESGGPASLTVNSTTTNNDLLYLYGHNTYSGGTLITGQAALGLGQNDSAGSGAVTLTSPQGGIALNNGVVFSNPLVFNSGGLAGLGTFAPSSVSGTGQSAGKITFGANQKVMPGLPDDQHGIPGTLTISINTAFANGGTFDLKVQNPTTPDGHGLLAVGGSLDLTSLSTSGFMIELTSLDANGLKGGFANTITWGSTYSIPFVQVAGVINGFNPTNFAFDATHFQGGAIPTSAFSVTADSTHLYLNFTAVPEPSTYALMALGLGLAAIPTLRRRRV
jgi:PEP-CTERM motif